jgi:hypothetical protein
MPSAKPGLAFAVIQADFGYRAMMAGKRVAIPGCHTRLQVFLLSFSPRA